METRDKRNIVVVTHSRWGRGETLAEARKNAGNCRKNDWYTAYFFTHDQWDFDDYCNPICPMDMEPPIVITFKNGEPMEIAKKYKKPEWNGGLGAWGSKEYLYDFKSDCRGPQSKYKRSYLHGWPWVLKEEQQA